MVDYIKDLIKEKKISLNKLETELGLSQGSIRHWDEKPPSYDKLMKVANYFGITIDEIVGSKDQKSPKEIKLIEYYRISDDRGKKTIMDVAELEAKRSKNDDEVIELKPFA